MRPLILDLVKRLWENNNAEYEILLKAVFGEHVPDDFKNTPTFCEKDDIEDLLNFNTLNEEGQKVFKL